MGLFGTSGIRGDPETLFTKQFCFDISKAFVDFLNKSKLDGPICVGYDPRASSPKLFEAIVDGLSYAGREILDQGVCPTPALNWYLKTSICAGAIMITGSHITGNLNGLKFFAFKDEILKVHEAEIEAIYSEIKEKTAYAPSQESVIQENKAASDYAEMLINLALIPYKKIKIVIDCQNGCQSEVMPGVLSRLGFEVVTINCDLQGEFKGQDTETQGATQELQNAVVQNKADMGIAYDFDGDRAVFVDELGHFIPGDYSGTLLARDLEGEKIITTFTTSQVIDKIKKTIIRTKPGSPYVAAGIKDNDAVFGFEPNGGCFFPDVMLSRDGGATTIKFLNIFNKQNLSLSGFVATLPKYYLYKTKVDCPFDKSEMIIGEAKKQIKGVKVEELDGVKIWPTNDSWILFRSSKNAPEFRVFAESPSEIDSENLAKSGIELVKKLL
jgi:phosphomannomutase / phosphoglucomutase